MKLECFECGAIIEADGADAAEAFPDHARENHDRPYPEEAVRTYARDLVDATERISSDTERRPVLGNVVVHRVTEDRLDDWLRFFDHDAFAGNPAWASCYCLEPHASAPPETPERRVVADAPGRGAPWVEA
ncbi:MAG TPA: hypothetical protein VKB31_01340 [Trueperaceae bacterium]|nr:hypothetical protein [Trueperaceae bacterium]